MGERVERVERVERRVVERKRVELSCATLRNTSLAAELAAEMCVECRNVTASPFQPASRVATSQFGK